jgi:hypothetical protein
MIMAIFYAFSIKMISKTFTQATGIGIQILRVFSRFGNLSFVFNVSIA